jgi:probable rRNA maturation factor
VTVTGADGAGAESWPRLAEAVLVDEDASGELDLTFVDETAMADLNLTHMGQEGPTDVLAFPIDGEGDRAEPGEHGVPRLLGDVVICPAVARRNAPGDADLDPETAVRDELALLVVHGVLHVLGWDHATEDERLAMQARERRHLDRWRSAGPPRTDAS